MTNEQQLKNFQELHKISLVYEHAIYFEELEETSYGVLAEDTNWMIRNMDLKQNSTEKIVENLNLLKSWSKND